VVDVDSVLLSVQERDKWRRRMELLERSLDEVRERRRRLEARLRRTKKELSRLRVTVDAVHDLTRAPLPGEVTSAPRSAPIR
jgi:septal ring factor EnvC (AmiA/AmiB activator)